ncbi:MAG: PLP-dependent aminotransferase family protein [Rhodobiaceae bacterium]|nr:PLP-dependent aminotransferase family protein [Rhodobiaceae bacterium]
MTSWLPGTLEGTGPLYLRLADRIESDIDNGLLAPGEKLPPQRNLAFDIGVTIGTVGRAYALLHERGLVSGEVGRGTYILERNGLSPAAPAPVMAPAGIGTRHVQAPDGLLRMDSTAATDVGQSHAIEAYLAAITRDHPHEIANYTRTLPEHWLAAGADWLAAPGWRPQEAGIVPALGGHPAILAAITAITNPGERILIEEVSYASVARSASLAGRRITTVALDEQGIIPDDLERVCAREHPRMLFLMPGIQNPTLAVMPEDRRHAVVEIARRYDLWLIEDVIFGSLVEDRIPSLAELAPERTFRVGGMSKSVAAGIRGGWISCPPGYTARIHAAHKLLTGGMPFLLAELAARLVLDGEAGRIRQAVREEIAVREAIARQTLAGFEFSSHPHCPFMWITVPEPWQSGTLKKAAENDGILIDDEDEFKSGRTERAYHRIRVGFTVPGERDAVTRGFTTLRELMRGGNAVYDSYS